MDSVLKPPRRPDEPARMPAGGTSSGFSRKSVDVFQIKHYFHIVVRRIWLVALCFIIAIVVTVVALMRQTPIYRCSTTLLLSKGLPLPRSLVEKESEPLGDYMETQQRIIRSPRIIQGARKRLTYPGEVIAENIQAVDVFPIGDTAFIGISVESLNADMGAEYANALADEYLAFKAEQRRDTSQATVVSLTEQANRLHEDLQTAEADSRLFARENSVVAIQRSGNIAANMLAELIQRSAKYRMERMLLEVQQPFLGQASDEAILMTLNRGFGALMPGDYMTTVPESETPAMVVEPDRLLDAGVIQRSQWEEYKRKQDRLEMQLSGYRKKYRENHPLIEETMAELEETKGQLELEVQIALREYYTQLEALKIKEQSINLVKQEWEEEAIDISRKQQEYHNIQRSINRLQSLYDVIFNRLKEIDVSVGIEPESVRIMERAKAATRPVTPRKVQSLFLAGLIGIGIGIALTFMIEFLDDTIKYPEEVHSRLGVPSFGVIPSAEWDEVDLRSHVLANIDQQSGLAEAYRNLRSSFVMAQKTNQCSVIALSSAVPREGKTTTCANMGVSLAQMGDRVLLVDGDLRRGSLHKLFGLEGDKGLSTILEGKAKSEAVIQRTGIANLDVIATGPLPVNPAELILRQERSTFMQYAREKYDHILIDCPPVMATSEASVWGALADGVLFVVWAGHTSGKLAEQAVKILRDRGSNVLGALLNNLELERIGYHYSSYYGYNYYYDSYGK